MEGFPIPFMEIFDPSEGESEHLKTTWFHWLGSEPIRKFLIWKETS